MKSRTILLSLGLAFAAPTPAWAQNLSDQGTFAVSADRLMGLIRTQQTRDLDDVPGEQTLTTNDFSFLGRGPVASPLSNPRVAFDYFVIDGLSIGGSIGYWSQTGRVRDESGRRWDLDDQSALVFAPRVGYLALFSDHVGIWPRGGFSFYSLTGDSYVPGDWTASGLAFNVDVPFVFIPAPHTAILVGPGLDVTLFGGGEYRVGQVRRDFDLRYFDIGLYAGLAIWF
jgi:hypothetical protein